MSVPPHAPSREPRTALGRLDDRLVPYLRRIARPVGHLVATPARLLRSLDDGVAGGRVADAVTRHRAGVTFVVVALVFGAAIVNAQRFPELQAESTSTSPSAGDADGVVPAEAGDQLVGPRLGEQVDAYLDAADERLDAASGDEDRVAVVSFRDFQPPTAVAGLFGPDARVHRALYQLPQRDPRPESLDVPDGLSAAVAALVDETVAALRAEEAEVASTIESGVEDAEFLADYEARLDELRGIRNILEQQPGILYAVVVTAPADVLRGVADRDLVRVVDVAGPGSTLDATATAGLLPTDRDEVTVGLARE